jgi:hypothetical protein
LFGIPFFLAFGFQYALEARLGGLNIFLFDGVRPLLEAMKNLDYFLASDVQYPIPRPRIAFAQFRKRPPRPLEPASDREESARVATGTKHTRGRS